MTDPPPIRGALLRNPRAHAHRHGRRPAAALQGVPVAEPASPEELRQVLRGWATSGVTRIVVDGGDGTVRELLGALPDAFPEPGVELAVLPSGKTNALARDVGSGRRLDLDAALRSPRTTRRSPVEVAMNDGAGPMRRGFVMGLGAYPDAIALAQHLHRAGLYGGLAVGAALAATAGRVALASRASLRHPDRPTKLGADGAEPVERARLLVLLSTLERLPLRLKPFGRERGGLKLLEVDAPPRRLAAALPLVLSGRDRPWLAAAGYRRRDVEEVRLQGAGAFVLDGELFEGGDLRVRRGSPITFVHS